MSSPDAIAAAAADPSMDLLPPKKSFRWPGFSFENCCKPPVNNNPTFAQPTINEGIVSETTTNDKKEPPAVTVKTRGLDDLGDDVPDLHSVSSHESGNTSNTTAAAARQQKQQQQQLALAGPKGMELLLQLCQIIFSIMCLDKVLYSKKKKSPEKNNANENKMKHDEPEPIPELPEEEGEEGMEVPFIPMPEEEAVAAAT